MGNAEIIIVAAMFGIFGFGCLGWMVWNLMSVVRKEGLSDDSATRLSQTKQILLKPALLFFAVGGLLSVYLKFGGGPTT